ncbi:MAG: hypothetical protein ACT4NY_10915 [Pseudonocardiales bacterium]
MTRADHVADAVRRAFAAGARLDLTGQEVPAELLIGLLTGAPPQAQGGIPALRLAGAAVRGPLALPGARVSMLVELIDCTFDQPIDLYAADVAGWRLTHCTLLELRAANLQVRSELGLEQCTVTGPIELTDVRVEGPLRLSGTHLNAENGDALDAAGVQVGGNLRCDQGFTAAGRVVLTGASIAGDAVFSGATLHGSTDPADYAVLVLPRGQADPTAALVADRITVNGNLVLDAGFTAARSVRLTNARIGGYLRLSGATLGSPFKPDTEDGGQWRPVPVALAADGIEVRGDLEARRSMPREVPSDDGPLRAHGQVRLVGAQVHGSASLTGARLHGPGLDVLIADRLRVGGTLFFRGVVASGSIRLHHAHIGSTLDCTGARLDAPRRRPDGSIKPSLDARAATIGKDLYASRRFIATGGVRLSLAEVSKSVSFDGARLGGAGADVSALRARGLTCQELRLRFAEPPRGDVSLAGVVAGSVYDGAQLWTADGVVDIEDFRYQSITAEDSQSIRPVPEVDVATRLRWLRTVLSGYDPDPYDQLAASYRDGGHDDRADTVLLAKQQHRHSTHGPAGRMWGRLQQWTVGYGYRPWRAAGWLAVCWALGSVWFVKHRLSPLDSGQNPSWQPVIYTADLLIPVVNLGQDGLWRTSGPSAWIAGLLTAVGWLLLTTAAAGVTRILTRR